MYLDMFCRLLTLFVYTRLSPPTNDSFDKMQTPINEKESTCTSVIVRRLIHLLPPVTVSCILCNGCNPYLFSQKRLFWPLNGCYCAYRLILRTGV